MKKSNGKLTNFLRKNAIYLVLALCMLAIGLSLTLMVTSSNDLSLKGDQTEIVQPSDKENEDKEDGKQETPAPVEKPVSFIMPVTNPTAISEYSEQMVFNSTLNRYSAHLAMDFYSPEGSNVYAVYDGVVSSIETTFLQGVTITIDHGNGLFTIYNSLADGDQVQVGQTVNQGDIIGQVSLSNRQEYKQGAHLHFEVKENGQLIDPYKYLEAQEK